MMALMIGISKNFDINLVGKVDKNLTLQHGRVYEGLEQMDAKYL